MSSVDVKKKITKLISIWIIPILFFGIFFPRQIYLGVVEDMSVWKAGGMGMFSAFDSPSKRRMAAFTIDPNTGDRYRLTFLSETQNIWYNWSDFKILPNDANFNRIIDSIKEHDLYIYRKEGDSMVISTEPHEEYKIEFPIEGWPIEMQLWKMKYPGFEDGSQINISMELNGNWLVKDFN